MTEEAKSSQEILKDELAAQCWMIYNYFMSSVYRGVMDEHYARLINGMFDILKELGRPGEKDA